MKRMEPLAEAGHARALEVLDSVLAPVRHHLEDEQVQEIMINNPATIWIERAGQMFRAAEHLRALDLELAVRAVSAVNSKKSGLLTDARLPGIRIAAVMSPVALHGHAMCLRKHAARKTSLETCVNPDQTSQPTSQPQSGHHGRTSLPADECIRKGGEGLLAFLRWAVETRCNLLVAGGTSSGKTTLANALLDNIPPEHRVITLEDTAELRPELPNWVAFEANPNLGVDIRALVKMCLRFRPDRIVVGEIRGAEAYDLIDSLNTGHPGGITTIHADRAESAVDRLETLMRMSPDTSGFPHEFLRRRIAGTFRFVIETANRNGMRGPVRIVEVLGYANDRYSFREIYNSTDRRRP